MMHCLLKKFSKTRGRAAEGLKHTSQMLVSKHMKIAVRQPTFTNPLPCENFFYISI